MSDTNQMYVAKAAVSFGTLQLLHRRVDDSDHDNNHDNSKNNDAGTGLAPSPLLLPPQWQKLLRFEHQHRCIVFVAVVDDDPAVGFELQRMWFVPIVIVIVICIVIVIVIVITNVLSFLVVLSPSSLPSPLFLSNDDSDTETENDNNADTDSRYANTPVIIDG
eukprot:CAMPEP_0172386176 /NCGR_PEP_ID=MMETSP1061-20121228/3768_1 /TAXON_ID=37318 /ORGANISM="Pseudo-nitzschia pungens, Strain cf. pungens" /LENGTH=162 /DNA_ID=CAMNT_0013115475 /DNA_START=21 /DNA_END=505 /DNA_ORIENTATION=-